MVKRKIVKRTYLPYGGNPNIIINYELPFGKDIIKPGDKIKFKNDRDTYIFQRACSHLVTGNDWIDCLSINKKSFQSMRMEKLKRVIRPKRSRAKRHG